MKVDSHSIQAPKILYAIQGTGNGHVARAREIIPILQEYGEVDIVLSGDQSSIDLPIEIKYRSKGLTFLYNKRGGVSFIKTLFRNNFIKIIKEIIDFPIHKYDVVINDFEFIAAWSAKWRGIESFGLGHQASFLSKNCPRPSKKDLLGEWILRYYAPCSHNIGFHFESFDDFIHKPVVRKEIRDLAKSNRGHYTVYLPAYGDKQIHHYLSQIPEIKWEVFSKRAKEAFKMDNVHFRPTNNTQFIQSFASCEGILTSAGFETPAEALFMGKKLFVVPIKHQYEQYCNAEALKRLGLPVANNLDNEALPQIQQWVRESEAISINYPDSTREIIRTQIFDKIELWQLEKDMNNRKVIY
jgi:uncharacterized protein (TIGR00661 family)